MVWSTENWSRISFKALPCTIIIPDIAYTHCCAPAILPGAVMPRVRSRNDSPRDANKTLSFALAQMYLTSSMVSWCASKSPSTIKSLSVIGLRQFWMPIFSELQLPWCHWGLYTMLSSSPPLVINAAIACLLTRLRS